MASEKRPFLFGVACALDRSLERLGQACLLAGAGTLRRRHLQSMSDRHWNSFYADADSVLSGFRPWEQDVYDRVVRPADRVLIVGSGSGRDAVAFARAGHEVVGVEPAPEAIAIATRVCAEHRVPASFIQADIESTALPGTFDLVVFSWLTYGLIPGSTNRVRVLARLAAHLQAGARVVITYTTPAAPLSLAGITVGRLTARLSGSDWRPEPNDVLRAAGGLLRFDHWFTADEISRETSQAGYRVAWERRAPGMPTLVLAHGDAVNRPPASTSWLEVADRAR